MARKVSRKARSKTASRSTSRSNSRSTSRSTSRSASKSARKSTARAAKKKVRVAYTTSDVKTLRGHSKARTPIKVIAKEMKRTEGSLRQKAMALGIRLGHRR